MKVKNKAVIKKLSHRVLAAKKKKNIISVLAIVLTTVLFTAVFTIGGSMIKSTRESTMIQVGSSAHAGMERLTKEQFDIVSRIRKYMVFLIIFMREMQSILNLKIFL